MRYAFAFVTIVAFYGASLISLGDSHQEPPPKGAKHIGDAPPSRYESPFPKIDYSKFPEAHKGPSQMKTTVAEFKAGDIQSVNKSVKALLNSELGDRKVPFEKAKGAEARLMVGDAIPTLMGDRYLCTYRLLFGGVPLAKTSDVACIVLTNGKVLSIRERNLPSNVDATKPTIDSKGAADAALKRFKSLTNSEKATNSDPELQIWVDQKSIGHLCWTMIVSNESLEKPQIAEFWVSAIGDPAIIAMEDAVHHLHNGVVSGTVWETTPFNPTAVLPLEFLDVQRGTTGAPRPTSTDGLYTFDPGAGTVTMKGTLAGPGCLIVDASGTTVLARTQSGSPASPINLLFTTTSQAEIAQVSAFQGVNVARFFAQDVLQPSQLFQITTRVNINNQCNAFFSRADVSVNFFKGSAQCPNTAYSDIIYHEYGHAIDHANGGILDGGYSEGFGDSVAMLITRQPCAGRDFFGPGTCLRDARNVVTWPPVNPEVHEVGRIYGGFVWELVQQLDKTGSCKKDEDPFLVAKRLVLGAAKLNPRDIPNAVFLSFLVDDDDGDLTNGSPHFAALAAAADSRNIPRPPNPTIGPPTVALRGCKGTYTLTGNSGSVNYCIEGTQRIREIHYERSDATYHYYCEVGEKGFQFAFSRYPDRCGAFAVFLREGIMPSDKFYFFDAARAENPCPKGIPCATWAGCCGEYSYGASASWRR